jgi:hypothetical protein
MFSPVRRSIWLLCLALFAGCQSAAEIETATPAVTTPVRAASPPAKPNNPAAAGPTLANPKAAAAQASEFKPPFPDRTDLFEIKRAQTTVKRDDEHGQSVELKGFIDVDRPRVVLSIDGVISPIPEGGEKYGVQVISIQPPKAVLQRGRNRWTATLD